MRPKRADRLGTAEGRRRGRRAFTLVELMITISIMAILTAIIVPKIAEMIRHANEAATRGKLGSIRSALAIYYADNEGFYPADMTPLMVPGSKYLTGVLPVYTYDHGNINAIAYSSAPDFNADEGSWQYINTPNAQHWGEIWVECTHTDVAGKLWTLY